jgi:hypothetical protein
MIQSNLKSAAHALGLCNLGAGQIFCDVVTRLGRSHKALRGCQAPPLVRLNAILCGALADGVGDAHVELCHLKSLLGGHQIPLEAFTKIQRHNHSLRIKHS